MSVTISILCACTIIQAIVLYFVARNLKKIITVQNAELFMLSYISCTQEMILQKIRYDVLKWKQKFIASENYEMAEEAGKIISEIEQMISFYQSEIKEK